MLSASESWKYQRCRLLFSESRMRRAFRVSMRCGEDQGQKKAVRTFGGASHSFKMDVRMFKCLGVKNVQL